MAATAKRRPFIVPPVQPVVGGPPLLPDVPPPDLALTPQGDVTRNITPEEAQSLGRLFLPGSPGGPVPVDPDQALIAAGQQLEAEQVPSSPSGIPKGRAVGPPQGFPAGSAEPGTLVFPKAPAGHPILNAIKRGFQMAMPLAAGAMEGLAAGAKEPVAGAALGKGFQAAEFAPYHKAKALIDVARGMQQIQLEKQRGALLEAQTPAVGERLQIQRDANDIRRAHGEISARLGEEKLKVARELAEVTKEMAPAKKAALEQRVALTRVMAEDKRRRIEAGEPEAYVDRLHAAAEELASRQGWYDTRTELAGPLAESTMDLQGARAKEARALAGSAGALEEQRRLGNVGPRGQPRSAILNNYFMRRMQIINGTTEGDTRDQLLGELDRSFGPYLREEPPAPPVPTNPYR